MCAAAGAAVLNRASPPAPGAAGPPPDVRPAAPADAAEVAALSARLFVQAYGATHPEPELTPYVRRTHSAEVYRAALADPAQAVLVARAAGEAVGYAHVRPTAEPRLDGVPGERPYELLRFYVDVAWQGRGVAGALLAAADRAAAERGADALWLDVWSEAARPLRFYERAGFRVVGATTFAWGARRDADHVMARPVPAPGAAPSQ